MAGLNEDAQWIVLMGFIVSFSFFFLAIVINQSTVVGQTTAESVLEFPKSDIRDISDEITLYADNPGEVPEDFKRIALSRKNAAVNFTIIPPNPPQDTHRYVKIHYNNGVTVYDENWVSP